MVAELAEELWDRFGFDVITDYSDIFNALSHKNYNVRVASAEALSAALDENQDKMQVSCLQYKFLVPYLHPFRYYIDAQGFCKMSMQGTFKDCVSLIIIIWMRGCFTVCIFELDMDH